MLWGIYHGVLLVLERLALGRREVKSTSVRLVYLLPAIVRFDRLTAGGLDGLSFAVGLMPAVD